VNEAEERSRRAHQEINEKFQSAEADIRRKQLEADRSHTARKRDLETSIERLRSFETELKQRLRTFLEQQVRSLDTLTETESRATQARPVQPPAQGGGSARQPDRPHVFGRKLDNARATSGTEGGPMLESPPESEPPGEPEDDRVDLTTEDAPQRKGVRGLFWRDEG